MQSMYGMCVCVWPVFRWLTDVRMADCVRRCVARALVPSLLSLVRVLLPLALPARRARGRRVRMGR